MNGTVWEGGAAMDVRRAAATQLELNCTHELNYTPQLSRQITEHAS